MEVMWFCIVMFLLTTYVVLDGFDLGAGVIHLFLARNESDRRSVLAVARRFRGGNEVCLLLAGGALYYAFPAVYLTDGFYFVAVAVVSLLILRRLSAEFRIRTERAAWKRGLDIFFSLSGLLLVVGVGAAVGCAVRGAPPTSGPRTLFGFPVLCGLSALASLTMQSAAWIALKSSGELQTRCRALASHLWWAVLFCYAGVTAAASVLQPNFFANLQSNSWITVFAVVALAGLIGARLSSSIGFDLGTFAGASCLIAGLLASAAAGQFPNLIGEGPRSLTIYNAGSVHLPAGTSAIWWGPAILLGGKFDRRKRTFAARREPQQSGGISVSLRIINNPAQAYSAGTRARASRTNSLALRTISANSVQSVLAPVAGTSGFSKRTSA